ncbi:GNAT family N-acetyltransferase [Paraliomyxa miuraensis]|uniref:GNAT family N-acetyltransferase n=1 Tax=Paraliomyxa miuraensis TaxID=376150 RepID=UPI00225AAC75|nr:GNAT family N-acetyltransferase [Paraliomyxa miuraensis]
MNDAEALQELLMALRRAFVPLPDTRVIERPGWMQLVTPSLRDGGMNEVCLAVLDPDEADAVIDATLAEYRDLGIRFRWNVGPDSAPSDLVARLLARGLRAETTIGLAGATAGLTTAPPAGVTVEPVDETNVEVFTDVMARGWDMDPTPLLAFHQRILDTARERVPMHLARLDGRPAGTAAGAMFQRSAYLMGAVVLPEARGRGLYRALVAARAELAVARGIRLLTTHARSTTSAPILMRLGFSEVCRFTVLTEPPPPSQP